MAFLIIVLSLLAIIGLSCSATADSMTGAVRATSAGMVSSIEKTEVTLKQAIGIVEKRRLTYCVARLVCELSCNPEIYGQKGKSVYETLKKFESDTLPQLAFYKEAKTRGQALSKSKCGDCSQMYANCKTPTETMLRLASALSIKS